jgi:hypothetical protein
MPKIQKGTQRDTKEYRPMVQQNSGKQFII